jgi:hypothetical protein
MDERYEAAARNTLRPLIPAMEQYPQAFGEALNATDLLVRGVAEVAIIGNPTNATTKQFLELLRREYRPNMVTALARQWVDGTATSIPLLADRPMRDDQPTVYVCRNFTCANPITDVNLLDPLLRD